MLLNIFLIFILYIIISYFAVRILHPDSYKYVKNEFNKWIASKLGDEWR